MVNAKPRLSPWSRLLLVQREIAAGRPAAHVAVEIGVSRATGYKGLRRFRDQGPGEEGVLRFMDRAAAPGRAAAQLIQIRLDEPFNASSNVSQPSMAREAPETDRSCAESPA